MKKGIRVCLITEGSYPYVVGGVSSWAQQLITNLPAVEFSLVSINPEVKYKGQYKYQLPDNLVEVQQLFLDELLQARGTWNKDIQLSPLERRAFHKLLTSQKTQWPVIFDCFCRLARQGLRGEDILMSRGFYDSVQVAYNEIGTHLSFTDFYWTLRSMYVHLFALLLQHYPRADIYHPVATGYAGLVGAYAAHINQGVLLLTEHGIYTREREEEIIEADWVAGHLKNMWIDYFYALSRCCYHQARQVTTLFHKNREIQVELGCPAEKITVIPNGVKVENFAPVARDVEQRSGGDHTINVGAVVRVVPIKDIKTMLQAFALVNRQLPGVAFYIMGPTDENKAYYRECVQYQNHLGLDNVIFTGRIDVHHYLGRMDMLVLTSISEGQPLVLLEAMAARLPLVVTDVGDCGALVRGEGDDFGPAGVVAPVMNYNAIARGIVRLGQDPAYRRKCGRAGFHRVQARYSFDAMINSYANLYQKLAKGLEQWQESVSS